MRVRRLSWRTDGAPTECTVRTVERRANTSGCLYRSGGFLFKPVRLPAVRSRTLARPIGCFFAQRNGVEKCRVPVLCAVFCKTNPMLPRCNSRSVFQAVLACLGFMVECRHLGCALGTAGRGVNEFTKCGSCVAGCCCDSRGEGRPPPTGLLRVFIQHKRGSTLVVLKKAQWSFILDNVCHLVLGLNFIQQTISV